MSSTIVSSLLQLGPNGFPPTDAMKAYCQELRIPEPYRVEPAMFEKNGRVVKTMAASKSLPTSCAFDFSSGSVLLLTPKSEFNLHDSISGALNKVWFIGYREAPASSKLHKRETFWLGVIGVGVCSPRSKDSLPGPLAAFMEDPFDAMELALPSSLDPSHALATCSNPKYVASAKEAPVVRCMNNFDPTAVNLPFSTLVLGKHGMGKTSLLFNWLVPHHFKRAYAWSPCPVTRETLKWLVPEENIFDHLDEKVLAEKLKDIETQLMVDMGGSTNEAIFIFDGIIGDPFVKNSAGLQNLWKRAHHSGISIIATAYEATDIHPMIRPCFSHVALTHGGFASKNGSYQFFESEFKERKDFVGIYDAICTEKGRSMVAVSRGKDPGVFSLKYRKISDLEEIGKRKACLILLGSLVSVSSSSLDTESKSSPPGCDESKEAPTNSHSNSRETETSASVVSIETPSIRESPNPGEFCVLSCTGNASSCGYHQRAKNDALSKISIMCREYGRRKVVFDSTFELIVSAYNIDQHIAKHTSIPIRVSRLHDIFGMFLDATSHLKSVNDGLAWFERDQPTLSAISAMQKKVQLIIDECHKMLAVGDLEAIMSKK